MKWDILLQEAAIKATKKSQCTGFCAFSRLVGKIVGKNQKLILVLSKSIRRNDLKKIFLLF